MLHVPPRLECLDRLHVVEAGDVVRGLHLLPHLAQLPRRQLHRLLHGGAAALPLLISPARDSRGCLTVAYRSPRFSGGRGHAVIWLGHVSLRVTCTGCGGGVWPRRASGAVADRIKRDGGSGSGRRCVSGDAISRSAAAAPVGGNRGWGFG